MRDEHNQTPREAALSVAIQALRDEWRLYEKRHQTFDGPPKFNKLALNQLAKIHNRMLEESGFDGMLLPDGSEE